MQLVKEEVVKLVKPSSLNEALQLVRLEPFACRNPEAGLSPLSPMNPERVLCEAAELLSVPPSPETMP